jgi:cytochrome P450
MFVSDSQFVNEAVSPSIADKPQAKKDNLLSRLASDSTSRTDLRNHVLALLLAGRDTTSSLLGWSLLRLSLHPDILTKLRTAILNDFPAGEEITFTKVKACRYLQHFLNEILRVHTTVPFNARLANKDTILPVGGGEDGKAPIAVRKGQTVSYSPYFLHLSPSLWGGPDDARAFRPERFAERTIPAWQFLPFSGGPRVCLGQQFALVEASFALVRLLQRFDKVEPVDGEEMRRMRKGIGLVMWPADGVRVRLHEAEAR